MLLGPRRTRDPSIARNNEEKGPEPLEKSGDQVLEESEGSEGDQEKPNRLGLLPDSLAKAVVLILKRGTLDPRSPRGTVAVEDGREVARNQAQPEDVVERRGEDVGHRQESEHRQKLQECLDGLAIVEGSQPWEEDGADQGHPRSSDPQRSIC